MYINVLHVLYICMSTCYPVLLLTSLSIFTTIPSLLGYSGNRNSSEDS